MIGWVSFAAQGLLYGFFTVLLMSAAYFCVTKYLAARGFAYFWPPDATGANLMKMVLGSSQMTARQLTGFQLHGSGAFIGGGRIMGMPMMPHYIRMMK